jgi:hypothetical protein
LSIEEYLSLIIKLLKIADQNINELTFPKAHVELTKYIYDPNNRETYNSHILQHMITFIEQKLPFGLITSGSSYIEFSNNAVAKKKLRILFQIVCFMTQKHSMLE